MKLQKFLKYTLSCLVGTLFTHSAAYAQIVSMDEWVRNRIDKLPTKIEDKASVCYQKGFELLIKTPEVIDIDLGEKWKIVRQSLLEKGFEDTRSRGAGSSGVYRPLPFICGQSGYSIFETCKLSQKNGKNIIQSTRATIQEIEVQGDCLYGLANKLKIREFETYEASQKRPLLDDTLNYLGLNTNMTRPIVDKLLLKNGWQNMTSDFLMNMKAQSCENNNHGWVLTGKHDYQMVNEDEWPIIQNIRVYFSAECRGNDVIGVGQLRKVLVIPN